MWRMGEARFQFIKVIMQHGNMESYRLRQLAMKIYRTFQCPITSTTELFMGYRAVSASVKIKPDQVLAVFF